MTASWVPVAQFWVAVGTAGGLGVVWWVYTRIAARWRREGAIVDAYRRNIGGDAR